MPKTSNALIRQKIIDKCLRSPKDYSIRDIMEACNEELRFQGENPVTALNTIRNDIENIAANYPDADIEQRRCGRNIYYNYKDKNYSIFKIPLNNEDLSQLCHTIEILSKFEGLPQFDWLRNYIERFKSYINLNDSQTPIVGFEDNIDLKGRNYFSPLFSSIINKQVLCLQYINFKKNDIQVFTIHPYYLKQYNKRWFLMAYTEGFNHLSIYALDRISSIEPVHEEYRPNLEYDFNEYFDDMIGVTVPDKSSIENIRLKISPERWPYIKTKPLHGTQKVISIDETGTIIQIQVYINRELEQMIMSYGEDINVLSPVSLRERIKDNFINCCRKYE